MTAPEFLVETEPREHLGLTPAGPVFGPPGYEINLLYIGALLALAFAGPSAWSLDAWLTRRRGAESPA
jgi:uncharacterized membrane protein YphA (DoxX/SURF4 family)